MSNIVTITFADGNSRDVPATIVEDVRGLDADGDLVIDSGMNAGDEPYLIPLTPCCHATGKGSGGSPTGVVCRACYRTVDDKFGGRATVAVGVS